MTFKSSIQSVGILSDCATKSQFKQKKRQINVLQIKKKENFSTSTYKKNKSCQKDTYAP